VDHNKLWKILKGIRISDHLTCLLRNLYAGQEIIVRTEHGTTDWFKIGKGVHKSVYCHPAYLTFMQSAAAAAKLLQSCPTLGDFTFTFHFHALEKEMATHSSVLAWRIPGTEEPGGLPSLGSHRVGHD